MAILFKIKMATLNNLPQNEVVLKFKKKLWIGHIQVKPDDIIHLKDIKNQIKKFNRAFVYIDNSQEILEMIDDLKLLKEMIKNTKNKNTLMCQIM